MAVKPSAGSHAGAQIEMVTRSGTNWWSGNAFDYLRNTALNADDFFNNLSIPAVTWPKFIQNVFGGSLGGPVLKSRTFIFGSYQGTRSRQEVVRNRSVLTAPAGPLFRWIASGSSAVQQFDIVASDARGKGVDAQTVVLLEATPEPKNFDIGDILNTGGY